MQRGQIEGKNDQQKGKQPSSRIDVKAQTQQEAAGAHDTAARLASGEDDAAGSHLLDQFQGGGGPQHSRVLHHLANSETPQSVDALGAHLHAEADNGGGQLVLALGSETLVVAHEQDQVRPFDPSRL